jgi:hypothetical protein
VPNGDGGIFSWVGVLVSGIVAYWAEGVRCGGKMMAKDKEAGGVGGKWGLGFQLGSRSGSPRGRRFGMGGG